ncbi:hypothetical protein LWI28_012632 [Acer negundo]|uniref:Uncharacterized protein n=1 Tax=Acer negundo TaxID=4023 RepID=A0AAD5IQ73_ACENE|nr:hypothetical protein LWI28_012632 [Acer negundo]
MPFEWITNYEKVFQNTTPVVASDTKYIKENDGSIKTVYEPLSNTKFPSSSNPSAPPVFQALMIQPVTTEDDILIHSFEANGSPIYIDKINGHFIWDDDPNMCDADCTCCNCLLDLTPCKIVCKQYKPDDPESPMEGLLSLLANVTPFLLPPIPCFMASNYDQDFPPLEPSSNPERNRFSRPYVQTSEVLPDGSFKQPTQAEQVLNWQTHNAKVQNRVLNSIDQKIDQVTHHVSRHENQLQNLDTVFRDMFSDLQTQIAKLDADLHRYINHEYFGPEFDKKEREIRRLKDQLEQMNRDQSFSNTSKFVPKPFSSSQSLFFPTSPPYSPPFRPPDTSQYFKSTGELFRKYPPLSSPFRKPTSKPSFSRQRNKQPVPPIDLILYASQHPLHTSNRFLPSDESDADTSSDTSS